MVNFFCFSLEFWGGNGDFRVDTHRNGSHDGVVHPGGNCGVAFWDRVWKKAGKMGKIPDFGGVLTLKGPGKIPDFDGVLTLKGLGQIMAKWEKSQILAGF